MPTDIAHLPAAPGPGPVPLISVSGSAYECGRRYAEIVKEKYPGYRPYLDLAFRWEDLGGDVRRLVERRAPYLVDLHRGLSDVAQPPQAPPETAGCTAFGVSGEVTLDGKPLSGQNKDTVLESMDLYIVLRMNISGGPGILVLAYPGEILGYGLWSTGMSVFRNTLHSRTASDRGLTMVQWALLTLAGKSVAEGIELAERHGLSGAGNVLISDADGESACVEFNAGGLGIVPMAEGISTHANHPVAKPTRPFELYPDDYERTASRHRERRLRHLLDAERGRLTPQKALMHLADHDNYPGSICRHNIRGSEPKCTTAAVVAEHAAGRLHVTLGPACMNWPTTYSLEP